MSLLVYSVVRRHMKRTSPNAFTVFGGSIEVPVKLTLAQGESVIGWYRNPAPWEHSLIVFSSEAFYVADGEHVDRIALSDIVQLRNSEIKD